MGCEPEGGSAGVVEPERKAEGPTRLVVACLWDEGEVVGGGEGAVRVMSFETLAPFFSL